MICSYQPVIILWWSDSHQLHPDVRTGWLRPWIWRRRFDSSIKFLLPWSSRDQKKRANLWGVESHGPHWCPSQGTMTATSVAFAPIRSPETNSIFAPENGWVEDDRFLLGWLICRGYVCYFQGGGQMFPERRGKFMTQLFHWVSCHHLSLAFAGQLKACWRVNIPEIVLDKATNGSHVAAGRLWSCALGKYSHLITLLKSFRWAFLV